MPPPKFIHTGITLIRAESPGQEFCGIKVLYLSSQIHPHTRYGMWTEKICPGAGVFSDIHPSPDQLPVRG